MDEDRRGSADLRQSPSTSRVSLAAHPERPFDLEDLVAAPDDEYRYEVLDGALVVNAAPTWRGRLPLPCYWNVDPDGPSVTLLELDGSAYSEGARFAVPDRVTTDRPFRVDFVAAQL